jgi:hypothetical protein
MQQLDLSQNFRPFIIFFNIQRLKSDAEIENNVINDPDYWI